MKINVLSLVSRDALMGLTEEFIEQLPRSDEDYVVGNRSPTYTMVMQNCSVGATREALWKASVQRAYPKNQFNACSYYSITA